MIVHRDTRCVVVDKPTGLATHRGWDTDDDALLQRVRDAVNAYVYPVHRLDRGASGLVLFALDADAARAFSAAWPTSNKRYLAITRGHPPPYVLIDHAIPKQPGGPRVDARTEIWCKETFGRYALVEARPHTGRLHQIRRHLKHISCPLIGDVRYGKGEHNRIFRTEHGLQRLALHCSRLVVAHPDGGGARRGGAPARGPGLRDFELPSLLQMIFAGRIVHGPHTNSPGTLHPSCLLEFPAGQNG